MRKKYPYIGRFILLLGAILRSYCPSLASMCETAWHKAIWSAAACGVIPKEFLTLFPEINGTWAYPQGYYSPDIHSFLFKHSTEKYDKSYINSDNPLGRITRWKKIRQEKHDDEKQISQTTLWLRKGEEGKVWLRTSGLLTTLNLKMFIKIVTSTASLYKSGYKSAQDEMHAHGMFYNRWKKIGQTLKHA